MTGFAKAHSTLKYAGSNQRTVLLKFDKYPYAGQQAYNTEYDVQNLIFSFFSRP